ncbi:hypothetical protein LAV79_18660 [Peribacillus butanolivorans]|uniref:hypothetical protein n=1 Tax=Peribacillus butanolivorans TaxID=421767 RepID=UPI0030C9759E
MSDLSPARQRTLQPYLTADIPEQCLINGATAFTLYLPAAANHESAAAYILKL